MIDDRGIFRTTIGIAPLNDAAARLDFEDVMVDTGRRGRVKNHDGSVHALTPVSRAESRGR